MVYLVLIGIMAGAFIAALASSGSVATIGILLMLTNLVLMLALAVPTRNKGE